MTESCKEHSYFIETRSPGLVGRIIRIVEERVFYEVYKMRGNKIDSKGQAELLRNDSNTKDKFFEQVEDGRLKWIERPVGG